MKTLVERLAKGPPEEVLRLLAYGVLWYEREHPGRLETWFPTEGTEEDDLLDSEVHVLESNDPLEELRRLLREPCSSNDRLEARAIIRRYL